MADRGPMVRMVRTFMYKHPRRSHGLGSLLAVMVPIALFFMAAMSPINIGSKAVIAAAGTLPVSGTVYSSTGSTVSGADVVVTILNGLTVRATLSTTSSSLGFYEVTFAPSDWDTGNTILVVASFSGQVGENSTIADEINNPFPTIDVHLTTAIPEFGGPMLVLALAGVALPIVFFARRRRHGQS